MTTIIHQQTTADGDLTPQRRRRIERLARARRYANALKTGASRAEVAAAEGISPSYLIELVTEAGLMPEVKAARAAEREQLKAERAEESRARNYDRARRWADALIAGETLGAIGAREGYTRERIRQVVNNVGLMDEVKAKKAAQRAAVAAERKAEADRRVRERKMSVQQGRNPTPRAWTDETIVDAVREWLDEGGSGKHGDWAAEGRSPSTALICQRLGWSNAVALAGGSTRTINGFRSDRASEQECIFALVAFLSDPTEPRGSYEAYAVWASRYGKPSAQAVRNRFGSWGTAKQIALDRLSA